ncbi:MAG: TetR/AcrR family transcriptional regulator [Desulfobacterales bacterium]
MKESPSRAGDTKVRIMDVAEKLFAENGFKRTSIQLLARTAEVNQAAVNYHFGSKSALVEQVIERRLSVINRLRMERLTGIKEKAARRGRKPDPAEVLRAFIEPVFALTEKSGGGKCILLIAGRAFAEPDETIQGIFIRSFKPSYLLLLELMTDAFPKLPEAVIHWRLHFVIGALAHAMRLCGSPLASQDVFPPVENAGMVVDLLVPFLSSGMNSPYDSASGPGNAAIR